MRVRETDSTTRAPYVNMMYQWLVLAVGVPCNAETTQFMFDCKIIEFSRMLSVIAGSSVLHSIAIPLSLIAQRGKKAVIILTIKRVAFYIVAALLLLDPALRRLGTVLASGSS